MIQQLKDLAALNEQGVLTDEELAAQKAASSAGRGQAAGVSQSTRWP
jgi:hypothetical protein